MDIWATSTADIWSKCEINEALKIERDENVCYCTSCFKRLEKIDVPVSRSNIPEPEYARSERSLKDTVIFNRFKYEPPWWNPRSRCQLDLSRFEADPPVCKCSPPCSKETGCHSDEAVAFVEKKVQNILEHNLSQCGCIGKGLGHGYDCQLNQIKEKPNELSYLAAYLQRMKNITLMEDLVYDLGKLVCVNYHHGGYYNGQRKLPDNVLKKRRKWDHIWKDLDCYPRVLKEKGLHPVDLLKYQWSRPVFFFELVRALQDSYPEIEAVSKYSIEDVPSDIMSLVKLCVFKFFPSPKKEEVWELLKKQYDYAVRSVKNVDLNKIV